jgi:hypothetical protein
MRKAMFLHQNVLAGKIVHLRRMTRRAWTTAQLIKLKFPAEDGGDVASAHPRRSGAAVGGRT